MKMNSKTSKYFISIDTHMNDIYKYEKDIQDLKKYNKYLKDENKRLEKENIELREKIKKIFNEIGGSI